MMVILVDLLRSSVFTEACDVLTTEIELVNTYALEEVASEIKIEPSWETIRIVQDKFQQKEPLSNSRSQWLSIVSFTETAWES